MIQIHVSAVLTVYDGYTGHALSQSALRCSLNGMPCRPEYRQGGYFVFTDLVPGPHKILLQSMYFQDELVEVTASDSHREERTIYLKPAENYPFGGRITRLIGKVARKGVPVVGERLHVAACHPLGELKIAQDVAKAGANEVKLYVRSKPETIKLSREYLIVDGKNSEICLLTEHHEGVGTFASPLRYDHKRGKCLYPAQGYSTDHRGQFFASFREPTPVEVFFAEQKRITSIELNEGINEIELQG